MTYRIESNFPGNLVVALVLTAATFVCAKADGVHPSLRHRTPGVVTYGSISTLPEALQQSFASSVFSGDIYAEPLLDQDVRRFINYREIVRDSSSTIGKLKIKLVTITESELDRYQYMGLIPEGPKRAGPWTSLTRVFLRPDGTPLFLYEWDFPADGGSVHVFNEMINEKVGETPARLVVKRSADGRAISELSWTTPLRSLTLSAWGDVLDSSTGNVYDKQWLKRIAESLSEP